MASKVVHVRNVTEDGQAELTAFASQFGGVIHVCFLSKFNQALIEMDSLESASSLITYTRANPTAIRGREATFTFSKSQQINQPSAHSASPNKVLLCTILNPVFSITTDVMYTIMSPFGTVNRIVVFNKNGVQALVEFAATQSAHNAKLALEGKDIYPGSCTLRIEFSHTERLNVHVNNDKTRDFTNPGLPSVAAPSAVGQSTPALAAAAAAMFQASGTPMRDQTAGFAQLMGYSVDPSTLAQAQATVEFYRTLAASAAAQSPGSAAAAGLPQQMMMTGIVPSPVLMVYGLSDQWNPDMIFNVLSLFGKVVKIKMLLSKRGSAMAQMEDFAQAQQALSCLHMLTAFGSQIQLQHSKHPYISESVKVGEGSNPTKDFSSSPLNRYRPGKDVAKPTHRLFFGTTCTIDATGVNAQVRMLGGPEPITVVPLKPEPGDVSAGIIECRDMSAAMETAALVNNRELDGHLFKLSLAPLK